MGFQQIDGIGSREIRSISVSTVRTGAGKSEIGSVLRSARTWLS